MNNAKATFVELVKQKYAGKRKARLPVVRMSYPKNEERTYAATVQKYVAYVDAPIKQWFTRQNWDRWIAENHTRDSANLDGTSTHDLMDLNDDMHKRKRLVFGGEGLGGVKRGFFGVVLKIADKVDERVSKNMQSMFRSFVGVAFDPETPWVNSTLNQWAQNNFDRISTLTESHIGKVNTILREGVAYGTQYKDVQAKLVKEVGMNSRHARLIAVDQIGKLNGFLAKGRQQDVGLDTYIWKTAGDERVRDSHAEMDGMLCKWDDDAVCSDDNGETWEERDEDTQGEIPGSDINCRCVALPDLDNMLKNVLEEAGSDEE